MMVMTTMNLFAGNCKSHDRKAPIDLTRTAVTSIETASADRIGSGFVCAVKENAFIVYGGSVDFVH